MLKWLGRLRAKGLFVSVWKDAVREIQERHEAESQLLAGPIVLGGSMSALEAVKTVLDEEWVLGGKAKALALTEIFSLAILSRWLASMDEQIGGSEEDREQTRREWVTAIMDLFGEPSQDRLAWFLNYDKQYRYEWAALKKGKEAASISHHMLLDMCLGLSEGRCRRFRLQVTHTRLSAHIWEEAAPI